MNSCHVISWFPSPCAVHSRFGVALHTTLPHAVGHGVTDGRHHHAEFHRPVIQIQRPYTGKMSSQVPVHPGALDTDQSSEIQTGPIRIWGSKIILRDSRLVSWVSFSSSWSFFTYLGHHNLHRSCFLSRSWWTGWLMRHSGFPTETKINHNNITKKLNCIFIIHLYIKYV